MAAIGRNVRVRQCEQHDEEMAGDDERRETQAAAILYAQIIEAITMLKAKL